MRRLTWAFSVIQDDHGEPSFNSVIGRDWREAEFTIGPRFVRCWRDGTRRWFGDLCWPQLTTRDQPGCDKVAIRVSIVVQFRVTDPAAAIERVAEYEDRLYSDVQVAARRWRA